MAGYVHPTKEQVREYMARRTLEIDPPPTPDEVRRELGWHLVPNNGPVATRDD